MLIVSNLIHHYEKHESQTIKNKELTKKKLILAVSIRASNGWYQSFTQDIEDNTTYGMLEMPVLGIGGNIGGKTLKMSLPQKAKNAKVVELADCGHFVLEEKPEEVLDLMVDFLGNGLCTQPAYGENL
ncbi:hypothetical protein GO495_10910 [Chitinophaga oryziterrae]|uniref:Alpha/beta hydrolase n=1 Tax=Chitinophaga oryziterrae TaxID=1031224 RepID=A0A6N8JAG9_9BACT|nr:alpha/beta hydrolase [Chitinophaga oryziterrae]MVT41092.1 hypothetical protein [Chitinophaga oryziterrae]